MKALCPHQTRRLRTTQRCTELTWGRAALCPTELCWSHKGFMASFCPSTTQLCLRSQEDTGPFHSCHTFWNDQPGTCLNWVPKRKAPMLNAALWGHKAYIPYSKSLSFVYKRSDSIIKTLHAEYSVLQWSEDCLESRENILSEYIIITRQHAAAWAGLAVVCVEVQAARTTAAAQSCSMLTWMQVCWVQWPAALRKSLRQHQGPTGALKGSSEWNKLMASLPILCFEGLTVRARSATTTFSNSISTQMLLSDKRSHPFFYISHCSTDWTPTKDHYGWETAFGVRTWHQNTTKKGRQLILPNQVALQDFLSVPEHSCNKSQ